MKLVSLLLLFPVLSIAVGKPRVYIQPDSGYESYLAGAIIRKHVPITIIAKRSGADYVLVSHEESSVAKLARAAFLAGRGIGGKQTATVELVRTSDDSIVWAYNVHKGHALKYQSTAEAVSKHLGGWLKHQEGN